MFNEFSKVFKLNVFNKNDNIILHISKHIKNIENTKNINIFKKIEFNLKSKLYPNIRVFQRINKSFGLSFFKNFYNTGVLKHVNFGFINKIFFDGSSKRRNVRIINKIASYIFKSINNIIISRISDTKFTGDVINKNNLDGFNFFKHQYPNRLKKKKRSLQRRSRKKIFKSLYGRIWLTSKL